MALIKCQECGQFFSDQADRCPHCGFANNLVPRGQVPYYNNPQPAPAGGNNSKKTVIVLLSAIAGLLLIGVGAFIVKSFMSDEDTPAEEEVAEAKVEEVSAVSQPIVQQEEPAAITHVYSTSSDGFLNIRQAPSAKSAILGCLYTGGDGAILLSVHGSWLKVKYGNIVGYVKSSYTNTVRENVGAVTQSAPTIYYVVIASHESLSNSKAYRRNLPTGLDCSPIFSGVANGKTVYRICSAIYYSKSQAERDVQELKDLLGITAWVWKSNGQAPCVDRPVGNDGAPANISPR